MIKAIGENGNALRLARDTRVGENLDPIKFRPGIIRPGKVRMGFDDKKATTFVNRESNGCEDIGLGGKESQLQLSIGDRGCLVRRARCSGWHEKAERNNCSSTQTGASQHGAQFGTAARPDQANSCAQVRLKVAQGSSASHVL